MKEPMSDDDVDEALRVEMRALIEAVNESRRSDGRGGLIDCWCDSEHGNIGGNPPVHQTYCRNIYYALKGE